MFIMSATDLSKQEIWTDWLLGKVETRYFVKKNKHIGFCKFQGKFLIDLIIIGFEIKLSRILQRWLPISLIMLCVWHVCMYVHGFLSSI